MYRRLALGVVAGLWLAGPAASSSGSVELQISPTGKEGLERDLLVRIKDANGAPVRDAVVEISVDMPSMPMAHHVPKSLAKAGSEHGSYMTRVSFEMPGEWAAKIEVQRPIRITVVRKFQIRK